MDADALFNRISRHRGPAPGMGQGPGRPWAGIVEQTPAVWVGWVTSACKHAEVDPLALTVTFHGQALEMDAVKLTYGTRYYWRCPRCRRRVEAIYATGAAVGCRTCLHLGYLSQASRPSSAWGLLDRLFSRRLGGLPRRYERTPVMERELVALLRGRIEKRLAEALGEIDIKPR